MFQQKKVIISCTVTGAIHTPSMSPYLPITADEFFSSRAHRKSCSEALHAHEARDAAARCGRPEICY